MVLQTVATDLIGSVAYGLGDINGDGNLRANRPPGAGGQTGDVLNEASVIGAFQIFLPLQLLVHCEGLSDGIKGNLGLALRRISDEFRM